MPAGISFLDPHFRDLADQWVSAMRDAGVDPTVTSTRRSVEEQKRLYDAYIHGRSKYPAAYPGTSLHEWGLAFDVETEPHSALYVLGPLWERLGFGKWGGRFTHHDEIHFEANEAVKKAAGYKKGFIYSPDPEKPLVKEEPIGKAISSVVTPWWSSIVPVDWIGWINKNF